MNEGMVQWLHTRNPVYSKAVDASTSNAWNDDTAEIPSISIGPEDALVWEDAVVSPVYKATFNM